MRIGVISTPIFSCPPAGYSGLETLAYEQARGLAAKRHQVTLFAPHGSHCEGAHVFAFGPPGQVNEQQAYEAYKAQLRFQDCIIDNSWQKMAYKGKQEGWLHAPVLGVCHAPVNTMFSQMPPGVDKPCFVCISKDQAAHFEALFQRPARVAYNGCDLNFYRPIGLPRTRRYLFLARFSTIKGPDIALDVCRRAGVGLDLIGDTTITQEPEYFAKCCHMADTVLPGPYRKLKIPLKASEDTTLTIHGGKLRGECVWHYSRNYALLHSAKPFREPFGLSPVEAQACEMPVLAFNNGAMRETVLNGETGFVVDTVEEYLELVKTDAVASIDRKRCREWASQFSIQNMVNRYDELAHEAASNGGW